MLIPHYKLETNPFAPEGARPFFSSESMHYAQLKLEQLLEGRLQSLFISGAAGVGKSALVEHSVGARRGGVELSWVVPGLADAQALLEKLVQDLGPGEVRGSVNELRNILEVFLKHQVAHDRTSVIVVDALERFALPVIRELEVLCRLRLRHRPLVHCVLVTRNEDLIANMLEHLEQKPAAAVHQRLSGFTLNETISYIRACLHGAGCEWVEELFPEETLLDVQAFTRGIVGDINALCRDALEIVAAQGDGVHQPRITRAVLKDAAARLHLRYDPSPWRQRGEESLSPDSVHVGDPRNLRIENARLIVTSGGRAIAEIALVRPRMVLGRDPSCDISLDSSYVSRYQNLFMHTGDGWLLFDLNSTNGCFVNGRRVREHRLRDGDLIAVGQHQLRFASPSAARDVPPMRGDETIVRPKPVVGKLA
ncbi:MAG TPA: FHA domain-containing protein [Gammaproteobacteria bacterium]